MLSYYKTKLDTIVEKGRSLSEMSKGIREKLREGLYVQAYDIADKMQFESDSIEGRTHDLSSCINRDISISNDFIMKLREELSKFSVTDNRWDFETYDEADYYFKYLTDAQLIRDYIRYIGVDSLQSKLFLIK